MRQFRGKRKGISALEMIVGVFILAFAALSTVSALLMGHRMQRQSEVKSVALSLARQQLETLLAKSPSNRPPVTSRGFNIPPSVLAQFPSGTQGIEFSGNYTVTEDTVNSTQQIAVKVRWRNAMRIEGQSTEWSEVNLTSVAAGVSDSAP
jgi:type II secretory pathway pseudopilin PulG